MTGPTETSQTSPTSEGRADRARRSNLRVAAVLGGIVVGMVGVSFAAVPLYTLFCQVTGFGGTTRQAEAAPGASAEHRKFTVRFDSNVGEGLQWEFVPAVNTTKVEVGVEKLAFYRATNTGDTPVVGTAAFNVTPHKAGPYFMKIDCFCFTEQVLKPGQTMDMPVQFFLDPELMKDPKMDGVTTVTLSYTFYPAEDQSKAQQLALAPSVE
ncbi:MULTISPECIES: cytochrome c oxidase assembly protein [Thalassobaculum]|uniref:Cytochrome c oxidase assembly protein CtaG n=1 Tax=Thalassobaculum litoreum DSM 18839 TaxID=1123362 RepID=A0A8G2BIB3_9PROT|nr:MULTISPECIES: cytochrome c oxidase assembly protein [Thalassobaculum]SDF76898.1 cytochrome c oxidase assembly protein subunit 11 [Thalassobaculum litoreum DSM 18839]